ncbi:cAMP-dependent protein kinase inhibitor beta [Aplochiton taeniatus]
MTDVEPVVSTDFASTGRTGRRNAIPDIQDGTADLPDKLAELTVGDDAGGEGSSTSPTSRPSDGEEKAEGT